MKKVVANIELKDKMEEAVSLICDAVSSTLGPSGNNVLIDNELSPFVTNDGVTIAEAISSDDKVINSILEIIKEASLKTNELVGDGTTTTLVLLKSLFNEGNLAIKNGKNAIVLRKEIESHLSKILELLDQSKRTPTEGDLTRIAETSCEDYELGTFLTKVFLEVKSKNAIKIEESKNEKTFVKYKKGYIFELDNVSNIYFVNKNEISLKKVKILLFNDYLDDLEVISDIINADCDLVILASAVSNEIREMLISYYLDYHKNIFLFTLPDYLQKRYAILNDLAYLSKATIKSGSASFNDLGEFENISFNKDEITFSITKDTSEYVKKLESELENLDEFDTYFMQERISKLKTGIAAVYIGGITKTEIKEKKMRAEDAINALEVASFGVSIGSGIKLLEISEMLELKDDASKILKVALREPFRKIYENCGIDYHKFENLIIKEKYQKIFNLKTQTFEKVDNTSILDPTEVLKTAIKNAISIASILLTTNYLVINENISKSNPENYI